MSFYTFLVPSEYGARVACVCPPSFEHDAFVPKHNLLPQGTVELSILDSCLKDKTVSYFQDLSRRLSRCELNILDIKYAQCCAFPNRLCIHASTHPVLKAISGLGH